MSEPALDRPGVVPLVGEGVAAGVAEHVRVRLELQAAAGSSESRKIRHESNCRGSSEQHPAR
jgi:hypothetical protein